MEFLVRTSFRPPPDFDDVKLAAMTAAERQRGEELQRQGVLRHLWRLPGTRDAVGIWQAVDTDELHHAIASLPAWPYLSVQVRPLCEHPNAVHSTSN